MVVALLENEVSSGGKFAGNIQNVTVLKNRHLYKNITLLSFMKEIGEKLQKNMDKINQGHNNENTIKTISSRLCLFWAPSEMMHSEWQSLCHIPLPNPYNPSVIRRKHQKKQVEETSAKCLTRMLFGSVEVMKGKRTETVMDCRGPRRPGHCM